MSKVYCTGGFMGYLSGVDPYATYTVNGVNVTQYMTDMMMGEEGAEKSKPKPKITNKQRVLDLLEEKMKLDCFKIFELDRVLWMHRLRDNVSSPSLSSKKINAYSFYSTSKLNISSFDVDYQMLIEYKLILSDDLKKVELCSDDIAYLSSLLNGVKELMQPSSLKYNVLGYDPMTFRRFTITDSKDLVLTHELSDFENIFNNMKNDVDSKSRMGKDDIEYFESMCNMYEKAAIKQKEAFNRMNDILGEIITGGYKQIIKQNTLENESVAIKLIS